MSFKALCNRQPAEMKQRFARRSASVWKDARAIKWNSFAPQCFRWIALPQWISSTYAPQIYGHYLCRIPLTRAFFYVEEWNGLYLIQIAGVCVMPQKKPIICPRPVLWNSSLLCNNNAIRIQIHDWKLQVGMWNTQREFDSLLVSSCTWRSFVSFIQTSDIQFQYCF